MNITPNVSAATRRANSDSRARVALMLGLVGMMSTSACLSGPRPSQISACPCAVVDPLARVGGVATAHRNDDEALTADVDSGAR